MVLVDLYAAPGHDRIDSGLDGFSGFVTVRALGLAAKHAIPWGLDNFDHLLTHTCPCDPEPIIVRSGELVYYHRLVREL